MSEIGELISKARTEKGLTQFELAIRAGTREETIQRIESGKTPNPGFETVQKIKKALGLE